MGPALYGRAWAALGVAERLFLRTDARDALSCWNWTGSVSDQGYGHIRDGRLRYTHRVAYEAAYGEIPDGLVIDHVCRNRRCCNPLHLEAVTQRENNIRGIGSVFGNHNGCWTHCKRGHPFDAEHTIVLGGARRCRVCLNAGRRERRRTLNQQQRSAA